jgi:hypothetical protein
MHVFSPIREPCNWIAHRTLCTTARQKFQTLSAPLTFVKSMARLNIAARNGKTFARFCLLEIASRLLKFAWF